MLYPYTNTILKVKKSEENMLLILTYFYSYMKHNKFKDYQWHTYS